METLVKQKQRNKSATCPRILFIDDDKKFLRVIQHHFGKLFSLDTALCGADALELLAGNNSYAVIVSDYCMPDMDGTEFLAQSKKLAADSVRLLFTMQANLELVIKIVNEGEIFRLIPKPCPFEKLAEVLTTGIKKYGLQSKTTPERQFEVNTRSLLTPEEIALLLRGDTD